MRRKWNRFVAGLLSIVLLVTMLPMEVLAAGNGGRAEQPSQTMPFQDVKSSDWCAKAVEYVYSHNLFSGTSATTFTPNGTMTRGMFVTVLGRMAGVNPDDHSGETPFPDVPQTMYYAPYVQWAARYGITVGTDDRKFSPDAFINRAQMAAFFVRYFEAFQVDYATGANITTTPADLERTPAYAQDAVLKLWKQGLLNGDGTRFAPEGNATRAQMATLCMRADEAVEIWYSVPGIVGRKSGETPQKEDQSKPNSGSSSSGGSSGGSGSGSATHTITLYLPDGTTSTFTQTTSALSLANLPTPSVAGKAFVGWYYDENYNKAVADSDPLSENLSLYAKMVDYDAIEGVETPTYAGATDVGPNFTIRVNSDSESDLTGKISLIGTEQPTSEVDADGNTILVVGSVRNNHDGTYTVAPPAGGWAEGGTYKVVLEDNSLYFDGTAPSVREYHFTVKAGTPALEWHLRDEVVAIPAGDITAATQDGAAVAALNMPVVTFDGSGTTADDVSGGTGTFVYGGELEIGSTVAIYEGAAPEDRLAVGTTDANTGDVSYVKITGVDKTTNTYSYQSATVEDVLFVPDVLPVQAKCKEDQTENTSGGHTILVPVEELTFTTASGVGNLDENTTVDVGDFLAFYTGKSYTTENAASDGYGRITAVDHTTDENTGVACYQLTYTDATEDDVLSSMDVDTTDPISGDAMLDGVDTEKLEKQIARQAIESGFAQAVADRISSALDEMDLSGLTAGDEIDLRSIDIDPEDALGISALSMNAVRDSGAVSPARANANGGGKASVKVKSAKIAKHLQNFTDASGKPLSGVRLELQLEVTKEIQKDGGSIVITVTPTFIQELKIDLSTHGKLVWKRKFIFFWISDVYLEAALNVYTYTAINLDATITSQGEKDTVTKVKDTVTKVKDLVDKLGKKLAALEGKDTGGEREEIDTSKLSLQELYNSMLELDSDWVELYRKNIFSMKKTVAKIIKFELTVDFVVEMNIRMAMGMNFNYTNAKRYVFGVYLFKRRTTTRTYNLVNEQYNLRLYAMGAVGLRAGVEIWPSVSLISKKVATVGIVAKLGAYLKGYGYVLYALHYEAGKPKTSNASGALYVEVGMFMDISANLSAFKGKVSWTPEIYTDETPLWSAGSTCAITAFEMKDADGEDDTPTVYLKNGDLDVLLPQTVQVLTGFDLITGKDRTETYDWNKFDISFDDPRFSTYHTGVYGGNYSQQHIKLNLSDWQNCDEPEIDCVMTLTYKGSDLSFSINPVQLKVKVHWDRLRGGYPIHELSSTGGYIGWEQRRFREALNLKTPTPRTGYTFKGWTYYLLKNESDIFSYTEADRYDGTTMPESALAAVATFELRTDIPYTLNFYLQNEDGTYPETPTESVIHHGTADNRFVPDETLVPDKIGYSRPHYAGIHIRPDGTGGQNYYYSRIPFTLILNSNGQVSTVPYRYGAKLDRLNDDPARLGYIFDGWYTDVDCTTEFTAATMPAKDLTLYAKWLPDDINYFLVLRKEGADGKWSQTTETRTGKTDETVAIDPAEFLTEAEKGIYTIPETVQYTVSAENGGTVSISYARKQFSLTYDLNAADAEWVSDPGVRQYRVGAVLELLTQSYVKRAGYTFDGWYTDETCTSGNEFTATTMPAENITLYAKWIAQGNISYTVEHYQQNVADDDYTLADRESKTGAAGQLTAAESKSYPGFTVQGFDQQTVKGDGSTVVKVYYNRNEYTLTYNLNGSDAVWTDSETDQSHKYRFGAEITTPTSNDLSRAGYAFGGWYTDADCTAEFTATTMPAENTTLYAKWNAGQVNYTVNYYLQNVDGTTYPNTPSETVPGSGVTGQAVDVQKSFEGFAPKADSSTSITLQADSAQNVVDLYYTRNRYTLSFNLGDGVILDEGSAPAGGDIYYGAEISVDMTNVKRTGYTFVGWYEDEAYQTEWSGTTMPARNITLYAKWNVLTYVPRFDWDGNVPLRDWLLKSGGKLLTAEYDKTNGVYINANYHGIPYIDVTVEYDQVFTLPTEIPGAKYFGYYQVETGEYGSYEVFHQVTDSALTKMAAEQGAVVKIGAEWKAEVNGDGARLIYNASQFENLVVRGPSSESLIRCALDADLDLCNINMTPNDGLPGNTIFDGNNHTIYHVKRGETIAKYAGGTIYGYGDNVTVKDLTIDGMTVDYTAAVEISRNEYHAFGALAGFVGDGFKAENVTVKNVTMNLNLLGEQGDASTSAHLLPAECIGGLIGYAKGTVTLTGCTVENMTVNVTDMNDNGGTQFLIGGLIGYADALYTQIPGENEYSPSRDYGGNGSVTITGCTVSGMTVDENGATGASVGGFLGGIGKHVVSKTGVTYSVTTTIDKGSTFPEGFMSIGKELTMNDSTASNSAARSLDAMPAAAFEDESDEENTAA